MLQKGSTTARSDILPEPRSSTVLASTGPISFLMVDQNLTDLRARGHHV
jgi:hypothetical protein